MLNGECIGGYTKAQWTSEDQDKEEEDKGAMLFNLTTHASFPCKQPLVAINCNTKKGPLFGYSDLSADYEPFNKKYACQSWTNHYGFDIPRNSEGINMLTNMKITFFNRCDFTISELEVWGVSFNQ